MSVGILTDSVADLPANMARELGIRVVPYNVHWGQETFKDGIDLLPADFYRRLASDAILPTTSCPSSGEYAEAYSAMAADCDCVVSLHITGKGSGAYQSACVAKAMLPWMDITAVDTCAVSMATGYIALEAARAARRGAGRDEVLGVVKSVMENINQVYAADTLKYLYLGGRIGRAKHMMGSLLQLKPLITMDQDGVIGPAGQALSRKGVLQRMVETMEVRAGKSEALKVAVVQGAAPVDAERLLAMIRGEFRCAELILSEFGPALGVHTGPGTLGVAFFRQSAAL